MPLLVEPMPPSRELRFGAPEEAQEASYFAASKNFEFGFGRKHFLYLFLCPP